MAKQNNMQRVRSAHEALVQRAKDAIHDVFHDTTVPRSQTKELVVALFYFPDAARALA